jgi:predicted Fe-Mo cluster-binding NifX family protein
MKIAIASEGKDKTGIVDERAGRAPYYLVFNGEKQLIETINNPFSMGSGGAGFAVAKMLADKEVNIIVAGKFGEKMTAAMEDRGVEAHEFAGSIEETLNKFVK